MDAQTAKIALKLMQRVQLSGAEVPDFVRVQRALQNIVLENQKQKIDQEQNSK